MFHMKRMRRKGKKMAQLSSKALVEMLISGNQPVVVFLENIHYFDSVIDRDFKGRVLSYSIIDSGELSEHYEFLVEIGKFEKYNEPFMRRNYFKGDGVTPCTYREAGRCQDGRRSIYAMPDDVFCRQESNPFSTELYEQYLAYRKEKMEEMTYVEWLENYVYVLTEQDHFLV